MSETQVTGEQLWQDLCWAAARGGKSLGAFARGTFDGWKLEQLRIAKHPTVSTIERVKALVEGRPVPRSSRHRVYGPHPHGMTLEAAELAGIPPSARSVNEGRQLADQLARKRALELARDLATSRARPDGQGNASPIGCASSGRRR